jgi:hypothetical protein
VALQERGLGTALSSILDSPSTNERLYALIRPPTDPEPDLCAFVFRSAGEGLRITGRCRPALADADFAFDLLDAARSRIGAGHGSPEFAVRGVECVSLPFAGLRTKGLLVLGQADQRPGDRFSQWAVPMCRALGSLLDTYGGSV